MFSCPDRYLFDPVTRLCQRENKVTCPQNLFYSSFSLFTVKLREEELEKFFSQELRLPRETATARYSLPFLPYFQPGLQVFYPHHPRY